MRGRFRKDFLYSDLAQPLHSLIRSSRAHSVRVVYIYIIGSSTHNAARNKSQRLPVSSGVFDGLGGPIPLPPTDPWVSTGPVFLTRVWLLCLPAFKVPEAGPKQRHGKVAHGAPGDWR